eukprot:4711202-Ditylum_brightwellii.AAC.1
MLPCMFGNSTNKSTSFSKEDCNTSNAKSFGSSGNSSDDDNKHSNGGTITSNEHSTSYTTAKPVKDKTTNDSMRDILGTKYTQQDCSSTLDEFHDQSSTFGSDFDLGFGLYSSLDHKMDTLTSNGIPTVAELTANETMTTLNGVANLTTNTTTQ